MNVIKKLREQLDLTQVELSKLLDVSIDAVRSWESGRRNPNKFTLKHLEKIAIENKKIQK